MQAGLLGAQGHSAVCACSGRLQQAVLQRPKTGHWLPSAEDGPGTCVHLSARYVSRRYYDVGQTAGRWLVPVLPKILRTGMSD